MADWKVVMDAVGDSAVQLVRVVPKVAEGCADAAKTYAGKVDRTLGEVEAEMPEHPDVLVRAPLGILADTIELVGEVIVPITSAISSTAKGLSAQVEKIRI